MMTSDDCVRSYKSLARVERAFRLLKSSGLQIRPIDHRLSERVRCHFFLCVLAYYVEWHLRQVWQDFTYADADLLNRAATRDPVLPARRLTPSKRTADGLRRRKFRSLLTSLSSVRKNTCQVKYALKTKIHQVSNDSSSFELVTGAGNRHARKLLSKIEEISIN